MAQCGRSSTRTSAGSPRAICARARKVYLEGQIQTRKWQDQSGNDRYTTEVVLQRFRGELVLLDSREGGGGGRGGFGGDFDDDFGGGGGGATRRNRARSRRRSTPTSTTTFRSRARCRRASS